MSNTEDSVSNSNGVPLTQDEIEAKAAEWGIPRAEARRMLAKKKLRGSS